MKKLLNKKNNKGFSLVELIVVVLIMGILAVALAPQVMKWVGKSKISTDKNNADALKSSIQTALADWQGDGHKLPGTGTAATATVGDAGTKDASITLAGGWTDISDLQDKIDEVTAGDYPVTQYDKDGFKVKIDAATGKVTVTCNAQSE